MSINCQRCDHALQLDSQFCPNCGLPTSPAHPPSGPDNIGLSAEGGVATPPSALEPAQPWQPNYSDAASTVAIPARMASQQPPPPQGFLPQGPPPQGPPPQGAPSAWAPQPGDPSGPPGGPGIEQPQFVDVQQPGGRGVGTLVGVGLGVVGLLAVGFLAVRFLLGGTDTGGAASPEAVVEEMVAAINAQDPLAAVSLMAPDELDGVDMLVEDATAYYRNLGLDVLDTGLEASDDVEITIELEADRVDVSMEGDNAAIVSFELSGRVEAEGDDGSLLSMLETTDARFDSRDLEGALPNGSDEVDMIVVKLNGNWYVSPMLTAGHYIVENMDMPSGDYDLIGGDRDPGADSAEEAIQALVDVVNDPDADDLAAALGGGEGRVALVFRDAIDEAFSDIEQGDVRYEVTARTEDLGNGRVEIEELELRISDDFGRATATLEEDCVTTQEDDERSNRNCLLDLIELDNPRDLDTTLFLDTVDEDGGRRVRIVPTITGLMGRFIGVINDRQTLLFGLGQEYIDQATVVEPGNDIEIVFDGQLYAVNEFAIEEGEAYNVTASEGSDFELWVNDDDFGFSRQFRTNFVARADGLARVVTYSERDRFEDDCKAFGCTPNGRGEATIRIRRAGRQSVPFPQRISGEFGPGDIRVFELEVESNQTVTFNVGDDSIDWYLVDDFLLFADGDTYELTAGTHELVVLNSSGDADASYEVSPSAG